jgi:2-polyprenyl-6-methoxyphenol hydroxylase-like FAD-dependent oxidoreductase
VASATRNSDRRLKVLAGRRAVVIGGGISGLAAALVLGQRGAQVTLLERDLIDAPIEPEKAFATWQREGAPQVRHSHVFLGRLRNLLRDEYPALLAKIIAAGARELRGTERPPPALANLQPEDGDEDLVALGCRRVTFECLLRQHVLEQGQVELVGGAQVSGLLAARTKPPAVAGLRYRAGNDEHALYAHLIVDASGRRSAAPEWLAQVGARPPIEETRPSGIVYYTRFYRMRPGAEEPRPSEHPFAGDFDWIKYAVFPADGGTFSITLAVPLAVQRLKVLSKPAAFDEMVRSIPGLTPWARDDVAEPIGDRERPVQAMGGLINRLRRFVDGGTPLALRFFVIGDAAYCTNPLYGRGCAQGFLHAHFLGQALDDHPDDLAAAAISLDRRSRREIEPYYRASILADRDAVRRAEGREPKRLEDRWRERFYRDGVAVALRCDPIVYRAFLRMMNMIETPEEAFSRPDVLARCLWVLYRNENYKRQYAVPDPPDREATIARCEAAARVQGRRGLTPAEKVSIS